LENALLLKPSFLLFFFPTQRVVSMDTPVDRISQRSASATPEKKFTRMALFDLSDVSDIVELRTLENIHEFFIGHFPYDSICKTR
jgi:hypothetical protein